MTKKAKIVLTSLLVVMLTLVLTVLIFLNGIKSEFREYLSEKYSELSFTVDSVKVDPIYGKFYAEVTCMDDYTVFPISKSFKTKNIQEDYIQNRSRNQYNSRINEMFWGSGIGNNIKSITGGGKIPFENGGVYTQINVHIADDAEHVSVAKGVMDVLKENNISAERIILTYERDKHVYEIWLSSDDYSLTGKEIEEKVKQIK